MTLKGEFLSVPQPDIAFDRTEREHMLLNWEGNPTKVLVPRVLPIIHDDGNYLLSAVREELEVLGKDSVAINYPSGEGYSYRQDVLEKTEINRRVLMLELPSGEDFPAPQHAVLLRWERDLPIVSRIQRGFSEFKRRARLAFG